MICITFLIIRTRRSKWNSGDCRTSSVHTYKTFFTIVVMRAGSTFRLSRLTSCRCIIAIVILHETVCLLRTRPILPSISKTLAIYACLFWVLADIGTISWVARKAGSIYTHILQTRKRVAISVGRASFIRCFKWRTGIANASVIKRTVSRSRTARRGATNILLTKAILTRFVNRAGLTILN